MTSTSQRVDVPGRIIPIIEQEFEDFRTEATAFLDGEREEATFIGFRLKQGVYGQRQPERQMIRVKLPFGGVTADQLDRFGEVAERYTPLKRGHITTRQNFQFHHIPLQDCYDFLTAIAETGSSTREACGNVVRNVTGDPWAGVRDDEPFDITPYAAAFTRYWVRNPLTQLLPRKFKVTFSGSDADAAMTAIHDLGFIPRIKEIDGEQVRGFRVMVGGGLSTMPKDAVLLSEFISVDDFLVHSEAVLRIFERADELRKNRNKARLKYLVTRVGEEQFRAMVAQELEGDWTEQCTPVAGLLHIDDEAADAPALPAESVEPNDDEREAFEHWRSTNVRAQRQAGYSAVEARVEQGDLTPEQFRGLATILREQGAGWARTTQHQNIVLRWIPDAELVTVWRALGKLGLDGAGVAEITNVVSCPGTDSCKLGITSSMGLNRAVQQHLVEMKITDERSRRILVNISGCPNSCGMHHIGNIGFHGAMLKSDDRQIPAYNVFMGGERREGRTLRLGTILKLRVPAKRVPVATQRWVELYEELRSDGEEFNETFDRVGRAPFEQAVRDLTLTPEFSTDSMQEFIDWERDGLYVMERGEGECAI